MALAQLQGQSGSAQEMNHQLEGGRNEKLADGMLGNMVLTADCPVSGSEVMMLLRTGISWTSCLKMMLMIFETTLSKIFLMIVGPGPTELCVLEKVKMRGVLVVRSEGSVMVKLGGRLVEYLHLRHLVT